MRGSEVRHLRVPSKLLGGERDGKRRLLRIHCCGGNPLSTAATQSRVGSEERNVLGCAWEGAGLRILRTISPTTTIGGTCGHLQVDKAFRR